MPSPPAHVDPPQGDRAALRAGVHNWLVEHWNADLELVEWRRMLAAAGWAAPSWPAGVGGQGLPAWADSIAAEEIAAIGAVGTPLGVGISLAGPTILVHGGDHVKHTFLLPILTGEHTWCQLFSEPGNGSDLAGLTTHAELDGDEWVVNGQKLWSTSAHHADFGLLLARSDPSLPKHRGISAFVLPMHQPGVEVRPLRQMNRHSSFNEVFLADAVVPAANMIGNAGDGWRVAITTLAYERRFGAVRRVQYDPAAGRALEQAEAEAEDYFATYRWYPQRAGRVDLVVGRAQASGASTDPVVRQKIAAVLSMQRAHQWTAQRFAAALARGAAPGATGSLGKLGLSNVARAAAAVHAAIAGAQAMLAGADGDPVVAEVLVSVPAQSIAGGTDEIQRNIIGEQLLGLPREPSVDRDIPFREIRRSAVAAAASNSRPSVSDQQVIRKSSAT
ncbi:MAG: acyl-CoA dehydrogenase family protein [Ilumatobacteraceae bacterium]